MLMTMPMIKSCRCFSLFLVTLVLTSQSGAVGAPRPTKEDENSNIIAVATSLDGGKVAEQKGIEKSLQASDLTEEAEEAEEAGKNLIFNVQKAEASSGPRKSEAEMAEAAYKAFKIKDEEYTNRAALLWGNQLSKDPHHIVRRKGAVPFPTEIDEQ